MPSPKCADPFYRGWNIQSGSRFTFRLVEGGAAFDASATLVRSDGGPPKHFGHDDLVAGRAVTVRGPFIYMLTLHVRYRGQASAQFRAQVKTDGGVVRTYCRAFKGKKGDSPETVSILSLRVKAAS